MTTISTQAELDAAASAILSAPCSACGGRGELGNRGYSRRGEWPGDNEPCPGCDGTGVPRVRELRLTPAEPLDGREWRSSEDSAGPPLPDSPSPL